LLSVEHMAPLTNYVEEIREFVGTDAHVPYFDPLDGGTRARVLFILEAPGPKAVTSGFISTNNPDPTARNFWEMLHESGLQRDQYVIWNAVPWYLGKEGKIRASRQLDIQNARIWLLKLIRMLKHLEFIVLVGRASQSIHVWLSSETDVRILASHHPSGKVKARWPELMDESMKTLRYLNRCLSNHSS